MMSSLAGALSGLMGAYDEHRRRIIQRSLPDQDPEPYAGLRSKSASRSALAQWDGSRARFRRGWSVGSKPVALLARGRGYAGVVDSQVTMATVTEDPKTRPHNFFQRVAGYNRSRGVISVTKNVLDEI
jgi:hypothetical protein